MIIFTHHTAEAHSILGAQVAATFLERRLSVPSIVVGIERDFSKERLLSFVDEYCSGKEKTVAFSHLCGRKDIIQLAQQLKQNGYRTILGGPQAKQDYCGEPGADWYPHRFGGLKSIVDLAFQGPVDLLQSEHLVMTHALVEQAWTTDTFLEVNWSNIYTFSDQLKKLQVQLGQVLNAVGCPYSAKIQRVALPPPADLQGRGIPEFIIQTQGCIFCDVSRDKGYHGSVRHEKVIAQIANLPERDGRKIPFELIDEYPIRSLGRLLEDVENQQIQLSQINLVCRVDDINAHASELVEILSLARRQNTKIMFASIGFESFSDRLLRYFCKGIAVSDIVKSVERLRRLKDQFKDFLLYRRDEGANHGFIRPTPWDDAETLQEIDRNIFLHRFFEDILPEHSVPLIIHHASYLGDWIRNIELASGVTFGRDGTWIEWWNPSVKTDS